ncbi:MULTISPECIES: hypothetical protein [Gammaproteobacteria]|nr:MULTISPECIES: hypothetical protein [Gammaproteobacteria]EKJ9722575.1 hypothetical protein [Pseudomonas aeruginosa]MDK7585034.1 hypothetical protein [Alcaligenes phenolicus]EKW8359150.1 hypothetical protein [Pseudomonas aeruginosa]MDH1792713.1 hypothetical protein [Stenotrophomonas sp. GD03819]HBO4224101.1 hypothetical protein [Pseudomonas aeruginosa]
MAQPSGLKDWAVFALPNGVGFALDFGAGFVADFDFRQLSTETALLY